ncbi:MAG: hypothetical protein ABI367_11375 [Mucilaginibacter sp.]
MKFLLLLGVSGVGKSTIIKNLLGIDHKFVYIKPYTNRPLRPGEVEKNYMSTVELKKLISAGDILIMNKIYGFLYATPKNSIFECLANGKYPLLDFPIQRLAEVQKLLPNSIYSVYILPENIEELKKRLTHGRINRLDFAINEISSIEKKELTGYDDVVINYHGKSIETSNFIYNSFINSFNKA